MRCEHNKIPEFCQYCNQIIDIPTMKLLYFSAPWCSQCKMMHPIIDELKGLVNIEEYDADKDVDMVDKYGIMSLPTMVIIKDGEEVDRLYGLTTKENLLSILAIS